MTRPVWETKTKTINYTIHKPVWETKTRVINYTVRKPVYETKTRTVSKVIRKPVHYTKTVTINTGHWDTQIIECPGPIRRRVVRTPGCWTWDPCACRRIFIPGECHVVETQCPPRQICKRIWVPEVITKEVPCVKYVRETVTSEVPYTVCRWVNEAKQRTCSYRVCKMVPETKSKTCEYQVCRMVTETKTKQIR